MDFEISNEQQEVRQATISFARDRLSDGNLDSKTFSRKNWKESAKFGLQGLLVPQIYGGSGYDCLTACQILEALGYGCRDHGLVHAIVTQIICGIQIQYFGSDKQKADLLPRLCSGEIILAQAITEPDAGSDISALRTKAITQGGAFVLNGSKIFVTNAPIADVSLVFAVTDQSKKTLGRLSCFLIYKNDGGFERSKPLEKMGLTTLQNGMLYFDDCEIGAERVLGRCGLGDAILSEAMEWERILLFSTQIGKMQHVFERCVSWARLRKQFGQAIARFQSISNVIAEMRINIELGRLAISKAAWMKDQGKKAALEASIAKLFVSESCKSLCLAAVQLHGGYGYMKETELERELRDSVAGTIYSGTSEIQRNIIARLSGL